MHGYTLLELVAVLAIVAVATGLILPDTHGWRDRTAVLAARESVAGLLTEARSAALTRGRGSVVLTAFPWRAWSVGDHSVVGTVELESTLGVVVYVGGGRDSTEISYGPMGLGRFANQTLEFRRGAARSRLIVSGYGRIRRD